MTEEELGLALAMEEREALSDPLSNFHWANDKQRDLYRAVALGIEGSHCAANLAAKTFGGAAFLVAILQGRSELDGVQLPVFGRSVTGRVLVPTFDQQVSSSQAALLHWLGNWKHEPTWMDRGRGIMSAIQVKNGSGQWSRLSFTSQSTSDPSSIRGQREDLCWCDEPPKEGFLREARKNARYRWITWTPLAQDEWEVLDKDFALSQGVIFNDRLEINTSVYENRFLPAWRIRELEKAYENDPFREARLYGHKLDISGLSPWGMKSHVELQRLLRLCQPGRKVDLRISSRGGETTTISLEVWFPREPGEQYVLVADPSRGIPGNDPAGMLMLSRIEPRLIARANGYFDAYELGLAAAHVADHYRRTTVDFDATGGYGEALSLGLSQYRSVTCPFGWEKVSRETYSAEPGKIATRLGFILTAGSRADLISAIRAWNTNTDTCKVWSRELVRCLLDVRVKKGTDKIEAPAGFRDEDMICFGRALQLIESLPLERERDSAPAGPREAFRQSFGRDVLGKVYREAKKRDLIEDKWR